MSFKLQSGGLRKKIKCKLLTDLGNPEKWFNPSMKSMNKKIKTKVN